MVGQLPRKVCLAQLLRSVLGLVLYNLRDYNNSDGKFFSDEWIYIVFLHIKWRYRMILRKLGDLYRDCLEMIPDLKRNIYTGALAVGLSALTFLPTGTGYSVKGPEPEIAALLRKHGADVACNSEPGHDIAITGISVLSRYAKDYNVPVVVNIENQSNCSEPLVVKLTDTTHGIEIGSQSVTLSAAGEGGIDEICDLIFTGEKAGDNFWISATGDIDGDDYVDLIVAATFRNNQQGRVYVFYGGPEMDDKAGLIIDGEPDTASRFGTCIASGDVDNDGYDDIIVGAWMWNNRTGRVYLFYGNTRPKIDTVADLIFEGEAEESDFGGGWDHIICDDIDGDNYDDIVIPAPAYNNYRGRAYLYWGSDRAGMDAKADLTFTPEPSAIQFGIGMDCGDIDKDGYKDIVIGAHGYPEGARYGRAYLYYGGTKANMDAECDLIFDAESAEGSNFGSNVGIGDVDNDGYEDVVIGANTYGDIQGRAYLYWGDTKANMDTTCDLTFTGETTRSGFGELCISNGDVNADGYADILIGARQYDNFRGRVYLYYGDKKEKMDAKPELILTGENEGDWFGDPPGGSFGDFNNDGYDDFVIGARKYPRNKETGRVYLYYGGPKN